MKTSIILVAAFLLATSTFAQSDKYVAAMKSNIAQLDNIRAVKNGLEIANQFTRIGDAEKTQWLPYYYAAYATITQGMVEADLSKKDELASKADDLIKKAETLAGKENSETATLKAMLATLEMTVDTQTRFMTYSSVIEENLQKAQSLDSTNPRPFIIIGQNTFYTPEAFGGGKNAAKPFFEKAKLKFESFKPETELSPNWGKSSLNYFLNQYK